MYNWWFQWFIHCLQNVKYRVVCYCYVTRSTIATFMFQNIEFKLKAYILKSKKINTKIVDFVIITSR